MLRNYLITALRNFARHRLYAFINVGGLAVGLACAIFIVLFLRDELSWNRWIPGSANIWRVEMTDHWPGMASERFAYAPFPLSQAMKDTIPDVRDATRAVPEDITLAAGGRQFRESAYFVDPNFFTVIRLPFVAGTAAQALANPESVVVTQAMARKYFGGANPIGKPLTVGGKYTLEVTGVLTDPPHDSSFQRQIYISNKSKTDTFPDKPQWFDSETYTFVRLLPGADPGAVRSEAQAILRRDADPAKIIQTNMTGDRIVETRLVRMADMHLSGEESGNEPAGSWTTIYGFAAIAALIIAIACFNFTNLATSRAIMRARETGLRKVVGAKRIQLIAQFLGESVLTAMLALVLALAAVEILLPAYDGFLARPIVFSIPRNWPLMLGFAGTAVLTGLLAGIYPSLVLSGFRPAVVLHPGAAGHAGSSTLRTSLVVLQFAISIALGIAALGVFAQIRYARQIDLGFDHDNVVVLDGADKIGTSALKTLEQRLATDPDILGVARSSSAPFGGLWQGTSLQAAANGPQDFSSRILSVEPAFFAVYRMKLLAGRLLSDARGGDLMEGIHDSMEIQSGKDIVVNAAEAHKLGFTPRDAVGKIVRVGTTRSPARVVGVVADTKFYGAHSAVDPTIYANKPNFTNVISLRVQGGRIPQALAFTDRTWHDFVPGVAIHRYFLEDSFDKMFVSAELEGTMFGIFVGIAIFIACLGLFGLAAFTMERRTKEIGVRKVFGARTGDVVWLLLWQFSIPVLIANVIAWPVAWYYLHNWLESYAFRITLSPVYFVAAGAATLVIAWATVIGHSLAVARANPVHALRYE